MFCTRTIEPGSEGCEIGTHQKQFNKVGLAKGDLFHSLPTNKGEDLPLRFISSSVNIMNLPTSIASTLRGEMTVVLWTQELNAIQEGVDEDRISLAALPVSYTPTPSLKRTREEDTETLEREELVAHKKRVELDELDLDSLRVMPSTVASSFGWKTATTSIRAIIPEIQHLDSSIADATSHLNQVTSHMNQSLKQIDLKIDGLHSTVGPRPIEVGALESTQV